MKAIAAEGAVQGVRSREAFMQPPPLSFTFTSTVCSGWGKPGRYGLCECDPGRGGWECEACDPPDREGCQAVKEEEREEKDGSAENVVVEGGQKVGAAELVAEQEKQTEDKKEEKEAGWDGEFHYKKPMQGADEREGGAGEPARGQDAVGKEEDIYRDPRKTPDDDGPYGTAQSKIEKSGEGVYQDVRPSAGGAGGREKVADGPRVNADGSVDAESMAAWEREQRQKRIKEADEGANKIPLREAEGLATMDKVEESTRDGVAGILCSFLTCHDDAGWSIGWLVGGVGLLGVVAGASIMCFLRGRFRRNHDSYRMLRFEEDDL